MATDMDVQQDMQATLGTMKHVSRAEEQLHQTEQLEAMTLEDLLEGEGINCLSVCMCI